MDPFREQALVARAGTDPAAFGELYDFYLPRIYGFVARRVADRSAAEDLTATTFERALGAVRRSDFRNESFGGFLYRVAANAVVDHHRRERRAAPFAGRAGDHDDETADRAAAIPDDRAMNAFVAAVDRDEVARALRRLPTDHRRAIVLRYFDGLDGDELGATLGCSRATAAVRLHRALRALRSVLAEESIDAA